MAKERGACSYSAKSTAGDLRVTVGCADEWICGSCEGSPLTTTPLFRTASTRSRWAETGMGWPKNLRLGFDVAPMDVFDRILLGILVHEHPSRTPRYCKGDCRVGSG